MGTTYIIMFKPFNG